MQQRRFAHWRLFMEAAVHAAVALRA